MGKFAQLWNINCYAILVMDQFPSTVNYHATTPGELVQNRFQAAGLARSRDIQSARAFCCFVIFLVISCIVRRDQRVDPRNHTKPPEEKLREVNQKDWAYDATRLKET